MLNYLMPECGSCFSGVKTKRPNTSWLDI